MSEFADKAKKIAMYRRLAYMAIAIIAAALMAVKPPFSFQSDQGIKYIRSFSMTQKEFVVTQTDLKTGAAQATETMSVKGLYYCYRVMLACSILCLFFIIHTRARVVMCYLTILAIGVITSIPALTGYSRSITDVVYDSQRYAALTPNEAFRMIHPLLLLNPGYGLAAIAQGQTSILTGMMIHRGWGRVLCSYLVLNRAGGQAVALITSGAITAAGIFLLGLSTLLIRMKRSRR